MVLLVSQIQTEHSIKHSMQQRSVCFERDPCSSKSYTTYTFACGQGSCESWSCVMLVHEEGTQYKLRA